MIHVGPLVAVAGIIGAALVVFILAMIAKIGRALSGHTVLSLLGVALTGGHLDGKRHNDATMFTAPTRTLHRPVDWPMSWWERQPPWKRAVPGWVALFGVPLTVYGWIAGATLTAALLLSAAALATGYGILRAARWVARRDHRRNVVRPVAAALAGELRQHHAVTAANLRIRPRLDSVRPGDDIVRLDSVPLHYAGQPKQRAAVQDLIGSRLPGVGIDWSWDARRGPLRLTGRCASAAPLEVPAADWLGLIDSLGPSRYLIAVSANDQPEVWDGTDEDPNAMAGGRARTGKTNLNLAVAGQGLRRGERFTGIDHKRVSLRCLAGVPGFTLANDPGDVAGMWAAIRAVRVEMDEAIAGRGDGVPHTLILEEINQLYRLFHDYWAATRPSGLAGNIANMPPARDIGAILHQGPQFGYRVLLGGQDLQAQFLFGYRHSFGLALLTGFTPTQWARTIGTRPVPVSPGRRGRFYVARAGADPVLAQVVVGDPAGDVRNEAAWRQIALNGRQPSAASAGQWAPPRPRPRPTVRLAIGWTSRRELPALIQGPKQAARYLGWTDESFRNRRRRHPIEGEFKDRIRGRVTACWARDTLDLWAGQFVREAKKRDDSAAA